MARVEGCLFCAIAAGDIPATVVRESERTLAFRDINPAAPTHVLVITKDHHETSADSPRPTRKPPPSSCSRPLRSPRRRESALAGGSSRTPARRLGRASSTCTPTCWVDARSAGPRADLERALEVRQQPRTGGLDLRQHPVESRPGRRRTGPSGPGSQRLRPLRRTTGGVRPWLGPRHPGQARQVAPHACRPTPPRGRAPRTSPGRSAARDERCRRTPPSRACEATVRPPGHRRASPPCRRSCTSTRSPRPASAR